MAENLSIKKSPVESVLECPLCLHNLKLPQTLQQCLHSYCKSCLDQVPQKTQDGCQGWLCPMCENFTKCDEIQQNTFIEELQKIQADPDGFEKNKCEQCSDDCSPATWKCTDCKIALCESAKITHLKIPMLRGHEVVPLESDGEKLIDNILFCKVHDGIPTQQNCRDCDQLICYKCNITDHQGHFAESVEQALERILPETESSAQKVNKSISILEAQIGGVKKEIEQTKESYASCRMQMDDHLEKVICRMRAMKAQMEEDVNEQESIALNTLKELKHQLEKQLSEASIISNLTAVVTTKTRHTSQLQQLQSGLFPKVKSASEVKNHSLSFNLPATNFVKGKRFKEEIDKVYGNISFDIEELIVSILGECYTKPNQFICSDLNRIAKTQFKKEKEIVVNATWCKRLSYINSNIWLPLANNNEINIYDEDGELEKVIDTGGKSITVVKAAHNGDIICAGVSGLFVTDIQFSKWTKLSEGNFSDVVVDNDKLIALQYECASVLTYSLKPLNNGQEFSWHESHSFMLTADHKVDCHSIICLLDEQFLLISTPATMALYKLTYGGEYIDRCKALPFLPMICGTDKNDQILISDFAEGTLYLFNDVSEEGIQKTTILSDVHTPLTKSVVIDQNDSLWILAGNGNYKLIKFVSQQ